MCVQRSRFENEDGDVLGFNEALRLTLTETLERIAAGKSIQAGRLKKYEADDEDEDDDDDKPDNRAVAQEPPKPMTPEENAAAYQRVIDHCREKLAEIEAEIAAGMAAAP